MGPSEICVLVSRGTEGTGEVQKSVHFSTGPREICVLVLYQSSVSKIKEIKTALVNESSFAYYCSVPKLIERKLYHTESLIKVIT